ncbi:hypothetical protein GcM3_036031 [Golovinomyces cichoracearum]|uniref:Uncharacterized protein n=1 Tax=Golovinomyces cichoracearum TaxID=62708 RepID=A0A420J3M1_9PEZI|nr:hypothetical protein GcM3_036031 [Golovinomyces cichoracearum]
MPATIETTIEFCKDSAIKYQNSRLQDEELWEIANDDLNEAIATGVVDIEILKPTSDYKATLMELRGVLRRNGVFICRKSGEKVTECFAEFLRTSANGTVPVWPLLSLQSLINSEVNSITDISLGLQYLHRKNGLIKSEAENFNPIFNLPSINQPISSTSTDDLPRILGNILRMY